MDEVIELAKDQIHTLIANQDKELTNIGRAALENFGQSHNFASHSDRYEMSISAQDFMPNMSRSHH